MNGNNHATSEQVEYLGRALGAVEDALREHDARVSDVVAEAVRAVIADMPEANAAALRKVLTDKSVLRELLDNSGDIAQERAAAAAGRGLWRMVKGLLSHWLVVAVIVIGISKVAGFDIAVKVWHMMTGRTP